MTLMRLSEGNFRHANFRRQIAQRLQQRFERWQQHSAAFDSDNLIAATPAETQRDRAIAPALPPRDCKARAPSAGRRRCDQGCHGNFRQTTMGQCITDHAYFPFAVEPGSNMLRHAAATIAKIFARRGCAIL